MGKWSRLEKDDKTPASIRLLVSLVNKRSLRLADRDVRRVGSFISCCKSKMLAVSFSIISNVVVPLC